MGEQVYYHGGFPGLKRGDYVWPPSETGVRSCSEFGAAGVHRPDRVYITTDRDAAAMWAACFPLSLGRVYEVKPIGDIETDPDCVADGLSFQCERARVKRILRVPKKRLLQIRKTMLSDL